MSDQNSILDKIIASQERAQAASFNPNELVSSLIKNLSTKEGDILSRRFGLLGKKKETLEQIGSYYNITRERIRQIETATVRKLKELKTLRQQLEGAEHHIVHLLEHHGGIMEEGFMLKELAQQTDAGDDSHVQASQFILTRLLDDRIEEIKSDADLLTGWKLPVVPVGLVKKTIGELVDIVEKENRLIKLEYLIDQLKGREFYQEHEQHVATLKMGLGDDKLAEEIIKSINSYLRISKKLDQNIIGEWGLSHWNTITPKRMSDKVYLILRKAEKPLHFTEITDLINQSNFDSKKAYPATIHNELILDDRYVLVGRGIYALKEWGYKSGTVIDIITDVLTKAGKPLTKEEIVSAVLEQRMVRKSTIYLALTNKEKIKKLSDGTYSLAA